MGEEGVHRIGSIGVLDQPADKGLGGAGMPRGVVSPQGFDDSSGGGGGLGPGPSHDFPLGVRDSRHFSHGAILMITFVIIQRLH